MSSTAVPGDRPVIPDIPLIRRRDGEQRTTFFELFFDLVYVFAITQLSHHLLGALSWSGAAETGLLLLAVYWAWNYTTWMANWFDPDSVPVRLVLTYVMLASLLMAVAIPAAFGGQALLFACCYVALQLGRNAFVVAVTPAGDFHRNFVHILAWTMLSAPLWITGGMVSAEPRWVLWLGALGLDLAAPLVRYWLPAAGRTPMSQWQIEGGHFAERFQLFVIIALGESIVLTGVTASNVGMSPTVAIALGLAFVSATALWWLYFGDVASSVVRRLSSSAIDDAGRIGRDVYTYLHIPIVAGIVLAAVGDELVIAHPGSPMHLAGALVALAGPAIYLLGLMACAVRVGRPHSWAKTIAVALLIAAIPVAAHASGLLVAGFVAVVLTTLVIVEHLSAPAGSPARTQPRDRI